MILTDLYKRGCVNSKTDLSYDSFPFELARLCFLKRVRAPASVALGTLTTSASFYWEILSRSDHNKNFCRNQNNLWQKSTKNHECEDDASVANHQQPENSQESGEKVPRRGSKKRQSQFLPKIEEIHSNNQK